MDLTTTHNRGERAPYDAGWPESLRTAHRICLASVAPAVLFTGAERGVYANAPFRDCLSGEPSPAGTPGRIVLGSGWAALDAVLADLYAHPGVAEDGGRSVRVDGAALRAPVDLRLTPVLDGDAVVGVFAMVDCRRVSGAPECVRADEYERLRQAAREESERANAAKARFLAAASHDLRQPFQAMRLFLGVLDQQIDPGAAAHATVQKLSNALEAGERLLHALLDISILDSGQLTPKPVDLALDELLSNLVEEVRPQAMDKGLTLKARLHPARVHADPLLLERIVRNLLSNAVRYTRTGTVMIAMRRRGDAIRVEVWDTGFGIPEEQRAAIFEEFHQLENPERDRTRGFGLGLAIVQRLAGLMKLPLDVRSQVGRGSVFAVSVPLSRIATAPRADTVPGAGSGDTLSGRTVLAVDDEEMVLFGLRMMLEAWGCTVVAAADLGEVIAGLDQMDNPPDIILTDLRLPGESSGFDVIRRVRRLYRRDVPAIVLTGETFESPLAGGNHPRCWMLRKPLQPDELRQVLIGALDEA
ncbi:ATP-binding response regulator [Azospirillum halopraeferens]|uniref:ATP-binding response regulator n=1 Tax=Azospirillum halopraeferens TaxID=34010 RepID=UPI0012EC533D|nr:hybrid sensor histidine kinase/response regulator [Azospirillum halopraeferens]